MRFVQISIACVVVVSLCLTPAAAQAQPVLYVDDDAASGGDGSTWNTAFQYLQDALAAASASGGTVTAIHVAAGTYQPDQGQNQTPGDREATFQLLNGVALMGGYAGLGTPDPDARDIEAYETILTGDLNGDDGPDFINNGENSYHVVMTTAADTNAILNGFTIKGGNANGPNAFTDDYGGGLFRNGGDTIITHCTFRDNWASRGGGGLYCHSVHGNLTINDCSFVANSARDGGGVYDEGTTTTLKRCSFRENQAVGDGSGAGMYNDENTPLLNQCLFIANSAASSGGGVYNYGSSLFPCYSTIINCEFLGNTTGNNGGGVGNAGAMPTVVNCLFSGNIADRGGGISVFASTATITSCTFSANSATGVWGGGAIYNRTSHTTMTNCVLWGNAANSERTSQIYHVDRELTVSYSCIQYGWEGEGNIDAEPLFLDPFGPDDTAGTEDDDLRQIPGSPCIDAADNAAPGLNEVSIDLGGNLRFIDDPDMADSGIGIPPIVDMGAYEYDPDGDYDSDGVANSQDNCPTEFNPDQADSDGDGRGNVCDIVLFVNDDAPLGGDGATWATAYKYLQDALSAADRAKGNVTQIWIAAGVYKPDQGDNQTPGDRTASFPLIRHVALRGGLAGNEDPNTFDLGTRDFEESETTLSGDLTGNDNDNIDVDEPMRQDNSYHVISSSNVDTQAAFDGFTVTGGNANSKYPHSIGGGMTCYRSNPAILNCIFRYNTADYGGGAIRNEESSPNIKDCRFEDNAVDTFGGAIYNYTDCHPNLMWCTFQGNRADRYGGAIASLYNSNSTVRYCSFIHNTAQYGGGAIRYHECDTTALIACTFIGNSANNGGAVFSQDTKLVMMNCLFSANAANWAGAVWNAYSEVLIANCAFHINTADPSEGLGGGVFHYKTTASLIQCTFAGNSAFSGSGMACDSSFSTPRRPSTVTATNCIFWDGENEIANTDNSTITINYSDVAGGWPGTDNIDADPRFLNPNGPDGIPGTQDDDLRLQPGSPCIDAGDNTAVPADMADLDNDGDTTERIPLDLNGEPRFKDNPSTDDTGIADPPDYMAIVDMGAYELQPITAILDILPGDGRNPFVPNKKSQGRIPMAILGSEELAAEEINPESIKIAGVISPVKTSIDKDVDGDGLIDLVMHFSRRALIDALSLDTYAVGAVVDVTVTATREQDGWPIVATDSIVITGPGH